MKTGMTTLTFILKIINEVGVGLGFGFVVKRGGGMGMPPYEQDNVSSRL